MKDQDLIKLKKRLKTRQDTGPGKDKTRDLSNTKQHKTTNGSLQERQSVGNPNPNPNPNLLTLTLTLTDTRQTQDRGVRQSLLFVPAF